MWRWLFPPVCVLCSSPAQGSLCEACADLLPRVPRPICLYCGAAVPAWHVDTQRCADCATKARSFHFARSALMRDEQTLSLVHSLKYGGQTHLARALAPFIVELWEKSPELREFTNWGLVPVPVSPARFFSRRYNQAEELARSLCELMAPFKIYQPLRRRMRGAYSQTRLSALQRMRNARLVFELKRSYASGWHKLPAHLLLVDDVYTTGATARACARLLRKLPGVKRVGVITLLRVPLKIGVR